MVEVAVVGFTLLLYPLQALGLKVCATEWLGNLDHMPTTSVASTLILWQFLEPRSCT